VAHQNLRDTELTEFDTGVEISRQQNMGIIQCRNYDHELLYLIELKNHHYKLSSHSLIYSPNNRSSWYLMEVES